MGVLDDAIREHLELKRRHGAGDEEIARKEAEALGPARRGPAPEPLEDAAPPAGEPVLAAEPEVVDSVPAEVEREPPPAADTAEPAPEAAEPGPVQDAPPPVNASPGSLADAAEALGDIPSSEPDAPLAETEPVLAGEDVEPPPVEPTIDVAAEVEPPAAIEPSGRQPGATQEFDTLSARDDDDPEADEDVLEETPEFLRETPEHDRLWFEQKPPRDFDLED